MIPLLVVLIAMILLAIVSAAFHHGSPAAAFVLMPAVILAFIGAYFWMFVLMLRLSLAFPASIAEDLPAVEAIRRSGQLTRGAKGRIFLVMLIVYAGMYLAMLVTGAVIALLGALAALVFGGLPHEIAPPLRYLGFVFLIPIWLAMMVLWIALPMAAVVTALAVFYRDQRLRIDGVSLPSAP
jgi:membrane-anchored glycerophosphoryl diester phosphodiesterase (GDPDase)